MVGAMLNTSADSTKLIPREPRSIVLDSAPVCRFKWKAEEVEQFVSLLQVQVQVRTKIKAVKVTENILSNPPDTVLGHSREHGISKSLIIGWFHFTKGRMSESTGAH